MSGSLVGCLFALSAWAAPALDTAPDGVAPARAKLVPWVALPPAADVDPKTLADDPEALVRFVESRPERLNVESMDAELAFTLAQVLLRGNRTFLAERLLHDATKKWPERVDLGRAWGRVLISLGRPAAAEVRLTALKLVAPGDSTVRYLLARAYVAQEPRTARLARGAIAELEAVLEINPQFTDPDGVTAADVQSVIQRIRNGGAPAAP